MNKIVRKTNKTNLKKNNNKIEEKKQQQFCMNKYRLVPFSVFEYHLRSVTLHHFVYLGVIQYYLVSICILYH